MILLSSVSSFLFPVTILVSSFVIINGIYRNELPNNDKNDQLLVIGTQLVVDDLNSMRVIDMDYRLDYFITYNWTISRDMCELYLKKLANANPGDPHGALGPGDTLLVTGDNVKHFWIPDTFEMDVKKIETPSNAAKTQQLKINITIDSCHFKQEQRLAATVACYYDFRRLPLDTQYCPFKLRSQSYPSSLVHYEWINPGVKRGVNRPIMMNHYYVFYNWTQEIMPAFNGENYSVIEIVFKFERRISNFIISTFAPTIIIVTVAYSSFWISVESGPGRFLLTVLTLLSLVTQFSGLRGTLPPVSYISALDVWFIICMLFVFSAIIELAVVNFLDKKRKNAIAADAKKDEDHQKYLKTIREKFESDLESRSYVGITPNVISVISSSPNPSRFRPFGRWKPALNPDEDDFEFSPRIDGSYNSINNFSDNRARNVILDTSDDNNNSQENIRNERMQNELNQRHIKSKVNPGVTFSSSDELRSWRSYPVRDPHPDNAIKVDQIARIVYPVTFIVFNVVYWSCLMTQKFF